MCNIIFYLREKKKVFGGIFPVLPPKKASGDAKSVLWRRARLNNEYFFSFSLILVNVVVFG
jgi:hypothetical protein